MPYSLDLRLKVMEYLESGGKASSASRIFGVSRASIYRWLGKADLEPIKVKRRKRKLDCQALEEDEKSIQSLGYVIGQKNLG